MSRRPGKRAPLGASARRDPYVADFRFGKAERIVSGAEQYCVYILASRRHGTLYIGVTRHLAIRLEQHRTGLGSEFVKAHGVYRLVYVEYFAKAQEAIQREKQLKNWRRDWKIDLIEQANLDWSDLSHLI